MIKEIIENKFINVTKNITKYSDTLTISFPGIGCNAKCFYCFQKNAPINKNVNIAKELEEMEKFFPRTIKEISLMGGELKILPLEEQLEIINVVNKLKKKYYITILVNDTKLDSQLMKIEDVCYLIHVLDWKNKSLLELDKKLCEINSKYYYKIVITTKDTKDEVDNFLSINKNMRERISFNIDYCSEGENFEKIDNFKINTLDIKQERFFCAKRRRDNVMNVSKVGNQYWLDHCCGCSNRKIFNSLKELEYYFLSIRDGKTPINYKDCKDCTAFRNF